MPNVTPPIIYRLGGDETGLPATPNLQIPYEIDWDKKTRWVPGANNTTAKIRVKADDEFDFITDMVGQALVVSSTDTGGNQTGYALSRIVPESNPEFETLKQWCMFAEQTSQYGTANQDAPADDITGWPLMKFSTYTLTFECLPYKIFDDSELYSGGGPGNGTPVLPPLTGVELNRYVVRKRRAYSKELTYAGDQFKIVDDGNATNRVPIMQAAFRVVVFADMVYTLYRYPVPLLDTIAWDTYSGKVNSLPFDTVDNKHGPGYNCANQTVLFSGFDDSKKYYDANGDFVADVDFFFKFNRNGWNLFLNNQAQFVAVSTTGLGNGTLPYSSVDLNLIFDGTKSL